MFGSSIQFRFGFCGFVLGLSIRFLFLFDLLSRDDLPLMFRKRPSLVTCRRRSSVNRRMQFSVIHRMRSSTIRTRPSFVTRVVSPYRSCSNDAWSWKSSYSTRVHPMKQGREAIGECTLESAGEDLVPPVSKPVSPTASESRLCS